MEKNRLYSAISPDPIHQR